MKPPVTNKVMMYRLLSEGAFGNTYPEWRTLADWTDAVLVGGAYYDHEPWAVRSFRKSDKGRLRLDLRKEEVAAYVQTKFGPAEPVSIGPVFNAWMTARVDAYLSPDPPCGLRVLWTPDRTLRSGWQNLSGLRAMGLMKHHLWPSDYDAVWDLLADYPGHVVEFSAFSRAVGTVPNRNAMIWEVRYY